MSVINSTSINRALPVLEKIIQTSLYTFVIFSAFSISITQIALSVGGLAWLIKVHLTNTWKELRGAGLGMPILIFIVACMLGIPTSVDLENSLGILKKVIHLAIFFWVFNTVQDEKQKNILVILLLFSGVVAALNGLFQSWDPAFNELNRIHGTMSVPSTFSGILMLIGLLAFGWFLFLEPKVYWIFFGVGIIVLCLLVTLTRQAWLGFFIGSIFLVFFWNKKCLLLIPLLLVGLILFAPKDIKERITSFSNEEDIAFQTRVHVWNSGWEIFKDYPITGCGFKCVDKIHSNYPDPFGHTERLRGMHNNFLQLLIDTGILGLGTWVAIWVTYFVETFKRWRNFNKKISFGSVKGIMVGSSAAVLGFLIGGLFETNFYDSEVTMLLYFIMGLSLTDSQKSPVKC